MYSMAQNLSFVFGFLFMATVGFNLQSHRNYFQTNYVTIHFTNSLQNNVYKDILVVFYVTLDNVRLPCLKIQNESQIL